jgi:quercetin dioxygenase-like cupin family protein
VYAEGVFRCPLRASCGVRRGRTLGPADHHSSEAHTPGTKELMQVQQGTITVEAAGQSVTLEAGDAAAFPGDAAHAYANPGPQPARFSLAVFEPGVGLGSRSEVVGA